MRRNSLLLICTFLSACAAVGATDPATTELTFVHLNDTYRVGAVEGGNSGGFGRVVTVIRDLQESGRDVRILHGGDFLYPSLESSLWQGEQMVDAFNFMDAIAPMYAVAGNHEFDPRSADSLQAAVQASQFDWLGDNYRFATGDAAVDNALKSAFIFKSGGKSIGIFALSSHPDHGGNERSYLSMDKDYVGTAERVITAFEQAGVDAIIGLTHLYMHKDMEIAELRANHPRFMFVVGGHDHEPAFSPLSEGSAAVMKGASNARIIWTIDLSFDADGLPSISERKIVLDESVQPDSEYQALENKWRRSLLEVFPFLDARIGTAAVSLDGREETIRSEESNWADFIVDQMRGAFGEPIADFAFINGGTLRIDDRIEDDILFEDVARTFGFSSFLRHTTVTGAEVRQLMEAGYRGSGTQGYFPQVSGFRVCVDRSRSEGQRIVSLQVPGEDGWEEVEEGKDYSLVVSDFLFGGGDGYQIPKDRPASRPASELVYLVLDAILDAQSRGEKIGELIDDNNRRYHELRESKEPCFN